MTERKVEEDIRNLQKNFLKIKSMGYVKGIRGGSTGVGATFEALLGKDEDQSELPDFGTIEIKTRRAYSKSLISLFNAVPKGESDFEVKRLRDKYGYPDKIDKNLKRLNTAVSATKMTKVGLFYYFKLKLDKEKEKLILCIYDWNKVLIDESTYWEFSILKEKLYRKLSVLAVINAWTNKIDGIESFKYYKMNIYILRSFAYFIKALEEGFIKIKIKIGNNYTKERYGEVNSSGISFAIKEEDLFKIFDYYR
ncbi:MAG: MvaI/BcnI restriction endonuclease family protein [Bacilli bacterium]|nr:MvaI/BcnI restriction endonuclease family protein [Bacilli bacterium]